MMTMMVLALFFSSGPQVEAFQLGKANFRGIFPPNAKLLKRGFKLAMISKETQIEIEKQITSATGTKFTIGSVRGGSGGGGGAAVGTVSDTSKPPREYFYKAASGASGCDMLFAEYRGVSEMFDTKTIRVPEPICKGTTDSGAFIVFEKLSVRCIRYH
jgi:hypothetical protein